jgi:2,4-dienoyl-CoA reductase-like NADH-dependent reductase (Old Yellow Enzyme family)/thioredoxin reductase
MSSNYVHLLSPGNIGTMRLKNRIVMPPMVRNFATTDGVITQSLIDHYAARAKGGAGLIIVEASYVQASGRVWHQGIGIDDDRHIPGLGSLTDAVKQWGSKIQIQLVHGGRQSTSAVSKLPVVAPSAVPCPVTGSFPRELSMQEVADLIEAFAQAARRAKIAGFDGVELHGAHGYIMSQFFSAHVNRRGDKYGGDLKGRATIAIETIQRIHQLVGDSYPVTIRINGRDNVPNGQTIEDAVGLAKILEAAGVAAIHVSAGMSEANLDPRNVPTAATMLSPRGHMIEFAAQIKKAVNVPVITVGSITPEMGEKVLREGKADFIAFGRQFLADPDLPNKLDRGERENIRPCIRCNEMCMGRITVGVRCTVNPEVGYEGKILQPAGRAKKVVVIGGGPAGMEAARIAALRGHIVTLYEKNSQLGGHLIEASVPKFKEDIGNYKDWLIRQMDNVGVNVALGMEITPAMLAEFKTDAVVIATGSTSFRPNIAGVDRPVVSSAVDVLLGKATFGNHPIVAGGGAVGSEVALYLARQGKDVTLVEMLPLIASDVIPLRNALIAQLADAKVKILKNTKIVAITDGGVTAISADKNLVNINGDQVILAMGLASDIKLYKAVHEKIAEVYVIGDSVEPRRMGEAIHEGYRVGSVI